MKIFSRFGMVVIALLGLGHSGLFGATQVNDEKSASQEFETVVTRDFENEEPGKILESDQYRGSEASSAGVSAKSPRSGEHCLRITSKMLAGEAGCGSGLVCTFAAEEFRGKRIRIRTFLDLATAEGSKRMLVFNERLASGGNGAFDLFGDRVEGTGWNRYDVVADISNDAKFLMLVFGLEGEGEIAVDDLSIEIVDKSIAVTTQMATGPNGVRASAGLFEILGAMDVFAVPDRDQEGKDVCLLLPLPLRHRNQYPLTYNLTTTPADALKSFRIYEDKPKNFVAEVILHEFTGDDKVSIQFNSAVMVLPPTFENVPKKAPIPETWPNEAEPWRVSTWCVESDHQRIKKIAAEIRADTDDVLEIVSQVTARAKKIISSAKGRVDNLIAVEAIDKQGTCTSNGNLVAALLRASDVPARVLSGYPAWFGPLQTHYIVEAYVPGYGWYPIESTMCKSPWPNQEQINVSIVVPEYESKELAGPRWAAAGGVPYLSLTEMPGSQGEYACVGNIPGAKTCDHQCKFIRKFEADTPAWQQSAEWAERRWHAWLESKSEKSDSAPAFGPASFVIQADSPSKLTKELSSAGPSDSK